jgi:hypothetical protein
MSYRTLKSKLFGTIGGLAVAGMMLAGVATITAFTASSPQAATPGAITPPPLPDGMAPVPAGNKLFLGLTLSAPRTTFASPQALASPTSSSRRRPPCSAKTVGKSSPTSTALTRMSRTLIQRWWPLGA